MPFRLSMSMSFMNKDNCRGERPKRKEKSLAKSLRQSVARDVADRRDADRVESIDAAGRAGWQPIRPEISCEVRGGEQSAWGLLLIRGPHLLGHDDLPKIVDAANGLLLLLGSQTTVQPVRRGNRLQSRGVRLPRGGSLWRIRAQRLNLSLRALGLRLGGLDLRGELLLLLAQLAHFVAQAQQVFVVLAQPGQLITSSLRLVLLQLIKLRTKLFQLLAVLTQGRQLGVLLLAGGINQAQPYRQRHDA